VITELEATRLLERADPVHGGLDAPVADAADYLDALLASDRASVVVEPAPNRVVDPAEIRRRRGPIHVAPAGRERPHALRLTAAAALIAALAASLTLIVSNRDDGGPAIAPGGAATQGQRLIAFLGDVSGTPGTAEFRSEVYVIHADGTGLRKLTDTPDVGELVPVWSPDGTRLAFLRDIDWRQRSDAGATVVVVDPTTGEETLAVEFPNCGAGPGCEATAESFGWSSDGRTITVFVANRGLHLLDVETRNWRGTLGAPLVTWSPTGKWVLIDRWGDSPLLAPAAALDDADPLAGGSELLGHHDSRYAWDAASWAPDEAAFAVAFDINRTLDGDERIDVFLTDSGDFYSLTSGYAPAWSPQGDRLAFRRNPTASDAAELWVKGPGDVVRGTGVPVDSAEHQVDTGVLAHAWSPDGSMLAYLRTAAGGTGTELWVASADGNDSHRVGESTIAPAWSPDGALLVGHDTDGLFTVRPDGTGRTGLTANADVTAEVDSTTMWQPAPGSRR
jgi:hypothetical protein